MSARHDQHCDVCGLRNGDHQCLQCNKRCKTVEELCAHQKQRQHFGGHFVIERAGAGQRRKPARRRGDVEGELAVDEVAGANTLGLPLVADTAADERELLAGDEAAEDADDDESDGSGDAAAATASTTPATDARGDEVRRCAGRRVLRRTLSIAHARGSAGRD